MPADKTKRCIDKMGRIVIPNDFRKSLGLNIGDEVNLEISGTGILITPVTGHCIFCNSKYELVEYFDKYVCQSCLKSMKLL